MPEAGLSFGTTSGFLLISFYRNIVYIFFRFHKGKVGFYLFSHRPV
jgi:hypothetical protein